MNETVRSAAGLVWRHQRLVWWIFVVNMGLAWLCSLPVRATLSAVLDHSLESAKLVTGFDLSSVVLMMQRPDVQMRALAPGMLAGAMLFLLYLLFIDGGVFTVFLDDRKLSRAEFFENAGLYFWRMVRLAVYSLVPFALLAAAHSGMNSLAEKLSQNAAPDRLGFFLQVVGGLLIALLALAVRLWFDLTQAQVVRDNERRILRTLLRSFRLTFASGLYANYIGIALFAALTFAAGIGVWVYLPHQAMGASFLVLELVTVAQIACRLWLKATSARWVAMMPAEAALAPVVVVETPVSESPAPVVDAPSPEAPVTE